MKANDKNKLPAIKHVGTLDTLGGTISLTAKLLSKDNESLPVKDENIVWWESLCEGLKKCFKYQIAILLQKDYQKSPYIKMQKQKDYVPSKKEFELLLSSTSIKIWNPLSSLEPLIKLRNLHTLTIDGSRGKYEASLLNQLVTMNFNNLNELVITGVSIQLTELEKLITSLRKNLKYLTLKFCEISDISPLRNLEILKELDISFNPISDISIFKHPNFKSLESLKVVNCQLSSFHNLSHLTNLRKLKLDMRQTNLMVDQNELTNCLEPLGQLTKLEELELYHFKGNFNDMLPLRKCKNLKQVSAKLRLEKVNTIEKEFDFKYVNNMFLGHDFG